MAGTAVNNSVSRIWMDTTLVTDGDFSTATGSNADNLGFLADEGSDPGNPEVLTEEMFVGGASVGGTYTAQFRVLGSTIHANASAGAVANPPSDLYIYLPNISETKYSAIRCRLTEPFQEPASSENKRTAWVFGISAKGDAVVDFVTTYEGAIVQPG